MSVINVKFQLGHPIEGASRESYMLYRMVTLLMTLSDPNHPKSSRFLRFGLPLYSDELDYCSWLFTYCKRFCVQFCSS